jgi:hypothetical protein
VTNPWHKRWQYQGRRCTKGWKCTVLVNNVLFTFNTVTRISVVFHLRRNVAVLSTVGSVTVTHISWNCLETCVYTVLGSKLYCVFCQISHLRGGEGGVNVWIARPVCTYWFRCHDIHDSLWRKHCIKCFDRDIASGVGLTWKLSRMTATCPQSRDEVTCVELSNYLKIRPWSWCEAIRLLKVFCLVEQESQLPSRHVTMQQNVPATCFHYQVRKMSFRSQSIHLVINFQWWCFQLTTFLDRTIPYGPCPGPAHHLPRAITNMASWWPLS